MQKSVLCRSRQELSNEYLLAKIGFDTAENEPCNVCPIERCSSPFPGQVTEALVIRQEDGSGQAYYPGERRKAVVIFSHHKCRRFSAMV